MPKRNHAIDVYIEQGAAFAKPILSHLRELVHTACPDVEETVKWGAPHFERKGILCSMAAFKNHCAFRFWKAPILFANHPSLGPRAAEGMGPFRQITVLADLPDDKTLLGFIREAVRLNEGGVKLPARPKRRERQDLVVPEDLLAALKKNKKAKAAFDDFSYSHKKEYVEWITEAKREETRRQRVEKTIKRISNGEVRMAN